MRAITDGELEVLNELNRDAQADYLRDLEEDFQERILAEMGWDFPTLPYLDEVRPSSELPEIPLIPPVGYSLDDIPF